MEYYITAIQAAAESAAPRDLKPALDFLLDQARGDYQAGALDVVELGDILEEYNFALMSSNAINYH